MTIGLVIGHKALVLNLSFVKVSELDKKVIDSIRNR